MNSLGLRLLASLEKEFAKNKASHYKGTARVRTSQLLFPDPLRPRDEKLIESIKRDFRGEGCLQHERDCSVPAIITDDAYQQILMHFNITSDQLRQNSTTNPTFYEIPHGINLNCLHGQHRILAASSYLPPGDRWWLVDLFGPGENENQDSSLCSILMEIKNYIDLILKIWTAILGPDNNLMATLDQKTVKLMELRVPAVSKLDSEFIKNKFKSHDLFPSIFNSNHRRSIMNRILRINILVPSIFTLFKDLRYLEPAAKAIKGIFPASDFKKKTLREGLRFLFSDKIITTGKLAVQQTEDTFIETTGSFDYTFDLAIRQLFLCAMRYFTDPSNISSKKNMNPIQQTLNAPKRYLGFKLLNLSNRLNFVSLTMESQDPIRELLIDILKTLPKEIFKLRSDPPTDLIASFIQYISESTTALDINTNPAITIGGGEGEPLSKRCGRACADISSEDRVHLFLEKMHHPIEEFQNDGLDITSIINSAPTEPQPSQSHKTSTTQPLPHESEVPPRSQQNQHPATTLPPEVSQPPHPPELSQSSPPPEVSQSAPPPRLSQRPEKAQVVEDRLDEHIVKFFLPPYKEPTFEVLFDEEEVNIRASEFAKHGHSFMLEGGPFSLGTSVMKC
ncbi:hypothetical protein H4I96_03600 [Botrytis cinerea]